MNPFDIVQRAMARQDLAPFERAFLKFLQGALIGLVIDGGNIMIAYYAGSPQAGAAVDWVHLLLLPLGTGFLAALMKWLSAMGDAAQAPVPPPAAFTTPGTEDHLA